MFLLTSQDECVYQLQTRLGSHIHNTQPLRIQFNSHVLRLLPANILEEQERYLFIAAQAAKEAINPADWAALKVCVKVDITPTSEQPLSFTRESRSVGLGYGLALAMAFRRQLEKNDKALPIWFATGELYASGQVGAINHLYVKCQAVCNYIKTLEQTLPFIVFYPSHNQTLWSSTKGIHLKRKLQRLGGQLIPIDNLPQALSHLLGERYDGGGTIAAFKGLESFDYQDQHRFFGRDHAINRLLMDFQSCQGLFVVTGVSGSGKSSIIKAGLIPKIVQSIPSVHWQVLRPDVFSEPKSLLQHIITESFPLKHQSFWHQWLESIWESPDTINKYHTHEVPIHNLGHHVWYIDQFEQILLSTNAKVWSHLSRCLHALTQQVPEIRCIVSVRSEYLHELGGHFIESHVSHALSPQEWQTVLIQQAVSAGLRYEEGLVDRLVEAAINTQYALPAVQYLLMRMHTLAQKEQTQILTHHLYEHPDIGGLQGAIAAQAQAVFREEADQKVIDQVFETFIGITSDGSWYAKRVTWRQLAHTPDVANVVKKLVNARLMIRQDLMHESRYSLDDEPSSTTSSTQAIRFAHDCLISNNSPWQALQHWMTSRKEYLYWFLTWENDYRHWLACRENTPNMANQWLLPEREVSKAKYVLNNQISSIKSIQNYLIASLKADNHRKKKRVYQLMMFGGLFIISVATGAWGWWEQKRSALLLNQVKENLTFLTVDLKEAIHSYLPTKEQSSVFNQVDALIKILEKNSPYDSNLSLQFVEHMHNKAQIILHKNASNTAEAIRLIEKSANILSKIVKHAPNDPKVQLELATTEQLKADYLVKEGKMNDAWRYYQQSHERLVHLSNNRLSHHEDDTWLSAMSASHKRLGDWLVEMGDTEQALLPYQEAFEGFQQLTLNNQNHQAWTAQLTETQINLANLYIEKSQFKKAQTLLQSALITTSKLHNATPKHKGHKINLARIHGHLGLLYSGKQEDALANDAFLQSSSLWKSLYHNDSKNIQYLSSLVTTYLYWADIYTGKDSKKENKILKKAEKISSELLMTDNHSLLFSRINSAILQRLGDLAMHQAQWQNAQKIFKSALFQIKKWLALHPEHNELQRDIALIYSSLGRLEQQRNNAYQASDYLTESLGYSQTLVDRYPHSEVYREDLYWAQRNLAELIAATNTDTEHSRYTEQNNDFSKKLPNQSEQYWWALAYQNAKHLAQQAPENQEYQHQLAETQKMITRLTVH